MDSNETNVTTSYPVAAMTDPEDAVDYMGFDNYDDYWDWLMTLWPMDLARGLDTYAIPIIVAVGLPGNIITLVVLFSKAYGWFPSNISLVVLSITDTVVLLYLVAKLAGAYELAQNSVALCKILGFLAQAPPKMSSLVLASVMVERALSVSFPLHAKNWLTKRRIWMSNMGILIFLTIYYIPLFVTYDIVDRGDPGNATHCHYHVKYEFWADHYIFGWGKTLLESLIPLVLIFGSVITIIVMLRRSAKTRAENLHSSQDDQMVRSITIMLLSVGVAFLILMAPTIVDEIGFTLGMYDALTHKPLLANELMMRLAPVCARINNAINFILYCVTGRKFRQAFLEVFCGRWRKKDLSGSGITGSAVATSTETV